MPSRASKKVRIRAEEVAHLLRLRGCVTARAVVELGFSRTQAEDALKYLVSANRAVRVRVGRVVLWCFSRHSAVKHMHRLRRMLHALICASKMKYVSPRGALELITKNKEARKLFSRYINPRPEDTAALHFLAGLLTSMYGEPAFRVGKGRMPIYFADCRRRRLPPLRLWERPKKEYRSVQVKVEPELREALLKAAEAEGVSVSALVRKAVERLLERTALHKALEFKNTQKQH